MSLEKLNDMVRLSDELAKEVKPILAEFMKKHTEPYVGMSAALTMMHELWVIAASACVSKGRSAQDCRAMVEQIINLVMNDQDEAYAELLEAYNKHQQAVAA